MPEPEVLCLKGTIVTTDALNCQRDIARQIVDQGGDYALALKGNQPTLLADVKTYFDDPAAKMSSAAPTVDGDHARIETRTVTLATDIGWLQEMHQWPGSRSHRQSAPEPRNDRQDPHRDTYFLLSAPFRRNPG